MFNTYRSENILGDNTYVGELLADAVDKVYDLRDFAAQPYRFFLDLINLPAGELGVLSKLVRRVQNKITKCFFDKKNDDIARQIMETENPDCLLRDTGGDVGLRKDLISIARRKHIKIIIYPHGTDIHMEHAMEKTERDIDGDYLLCPSSFMREYHSDVDSRIERVVVGNPRYDQWWIRYIRARWLERGYTPGWKVKGRYRVLFITRGPHSTYLSKDNFKYLITTTMQTILSRDDAFVVIRPHPRQSEAQLKELLKMFDANRWVIDKTDIFCISEDIDLVISMWSSMILDALSVGLPVIEYFRFKGSSLLWSKDQNNKPVTAYGKYGLVLRAESTQDLLRHMTEVREHRDRVVAEQKKNFRQLVSDSDSQATLKTIDVITGKLQHTGPYRNA
ncbi:MAG: hypothetical protein AB7S78_07630 [Candidatus Omnitrophota bacterium]